MMAVSNNSNNNNNNNDGTAMSSSTINQLLLSNLRILGIVSPEIASLTLQIISSENTLHALFIALSPEETHKAFRDCWPIYEPHQLKEFRVVAYKWLTELKGKGHLGSAIVRKSLLEDRQGERYELLLLALSSYILRNKLPKPLIRDSQRLVSETTSDPLKIKVNSLLYTYALSKHVRRHNQIHAETQSFATHLHSKNTELTHKESLRKQSLDFAVINRDCNHECTRWERNWNAIKAEWILDSIRMSLSPSPPVDFFSQTYEEAFRNYIPISLKTGDTVIAHAIQTSRNTLSNFRGMEKSLREEIRQLEGQVTPVVTPSRRTSARKSLPAMSVVTPSPEKKKSGIQFKRSMSRLARSVSEEPPPARTMATEHGRDILNFFEADAVQTLESLMSDLKELEMVGEVEIKSEGIQKKKIERSGIPRRPMSVNSST